MAASLNDRQLAALERTRKAARWLKELAKDMDGLNLLILERRLFMAAADVEDAVSLQQRAFRDGSLLDSD